MLFDGVLLEALARLALAILVTLLGVAVLFRGRRYVWLFSGAAALLLSIVLVRVLGVTFGFETEGQLWVDLIPLGAAVVGALVGMSRRIVADVLIGLSVGGTLALWVARVFLSVETGLDFWSALALILCMILGALFVLRYGDVALILLSAGVGVSLIIDGLNLSVDSGVVAALAMAACIVGLVYQYHDYLVEQRALRRAKEMAALPTPDATLAPATVPTLPAK